MSRPHECLEHCSPEGVFWFSFDFSARRFSPWPRAYTWEGEGNREPPFGDKTEWFWLIDFRSVRGNQCWMLGAGGKVAFLQMTAVGRWESRVSWVQLQLRQGDRGLSREEEQKGIVETWRQENKRGARKEMGKWKIAGEWVEIADNDLAKWAEPMYISQFGMCPCSVALSCPTLCGPMGCSPPGSSVRGILQARILERGDISFSRGSSRSRDRTRVSYICIGRQVLHH